MNDLKAYPHDLEAERSLLAQAMASADVLDEVRGRLKAEHFYRPDHRNIFSMLCAMADERVPVDVVTMVDRAGRGAASSRYGGISYIVELDGYHVSTANWAMYARIIRDKYIARVTLDQIEGLRARCLDNTADVVELVGGVVRSLEGVLALGTVAGGVSGQDALDRLLEQQAAVYRGEVSPGMQTGFVDLDRFVSLHGGEVLVCAARPGVGKPAFGLSLCLKWAHDFHKAGDKQVVIFSLEMQAAALMGRLCSDVGNVPGEAMRHRSMSHDEFDRFTDATNELRALPIRIFDKAGMTIQEMRSQAMAAHRAKPVGVVLVDYVQLLRSEEKGLGSVDRIDAASKAVKAMAKDLDCPVVLLAQVNREGSQRKRPQMSDLKGSSAIEEDADQVILMSRPGIMGEDEPDEKTILDIVKHRGGATGSVELHFDLQYSRFEDAPI